METASLTGLQEQHRQTISVIMPVRNAESTIGDQLSSLASQDFEGEWELIIADNDSTDRSLDIVRHWSRKIPVVRIVDASSKIGVNHARNVGSSSARGTFLLFCDADDMVAPGWIAAMARAAHVADMVAGRLEEKRLNQYPTTSWRLNPTKDGLPVVLGFLPYAVGCNLGVRATVLEEVGGWNEAYRGGGDEVELSWRVQLNGFALRYAPEAVVHSRHRESLWAMARQRYRYGIGTARLYADFHSHGIPADNLISPALRVWKRLIFRTLRHLFLGTEKRGIWMRDASFSVGILAGMVRVLLRRIRDGLWQEPLS